MTCKQCGGIMVLDKDKKSASCPFCGAEEPLDNLSKEELKLLLDNAVKDIKNDNQKNADRIVEENRKLVKESYASRIINETSTQTKLDEDAEIYKSRNNKSASENFKNLKGKAKFSYFKDYYLGKVIVAVLILALLGGLVYTFLKPKQEPVLYIAMIVSPFMPEAQEQFKADLTDMFVKDEDHENIMLDTNYSSLVADYNSMMSYTMHMSAGEIDMLICTKDELKYQVNNGVVIPVKEAISKEIFDSIDDSLKYKVTPAKLLDNGDAEYGEEDIYGLNLEKFLEKINGFETSNKYVVAFIGIAPHKDKFDEVAKYLFE